MFDWAVVRNFDLEDEHTLQSLFEICSRAHSNLDQLPPDPEFAQELLNGYIKIACHCARRVEVLGLFSENEDADDLSTASLRYILVRFFVAEGYADTRERAPLARLRALYEAIKWYKEFILICERYMLIHSSAANSAQCISLGEDGSNQHAARMEKIEQRTHERALREKLLQILSAMRTSDLADVPADCDEELERDLWNTSIHAASIKSVHAMEMVRKEVCMLKMTVRAHGRADPEEAGEQANPEARQLEREQRKAEMRSTLLEIAKTLSTRQDRGEAVFKPSHILPTYTVEQAGLIELEEMRIKEEREVQQKLQEEQRRLRLIGDEADDEDLNHQRAMDDWKDDHPVGYGNSKLRPCAI